MFTVVFLTESHRIRAEEEEEDLLDSYSTPAKVRKWKTLSQGRDLLEQRDNALLVPNEKVLYSSALTIKSALTQFLFDLL